MKKSLLLAMLFCAPNLALAADPTGNWRFDVDHFQAQVGAFLEKELAEMPETMRPQMEQMIEGMFAGMQSQMAGVATFNSDGGVFFTSDAGKVETGTWQDQGGNVITITPENREAGDVMTAIVYEGQMVVSVEGLDMPIPLEMTWNKE